MKKSRTLKLVFCALFAALIAAGAFIKIPVPAVPFTLQYLFTLLAGLLLGSKLGLVSVLVYIALGLAGVPIFTQGGGIGYVFQPTFGYLVGFAVGTFVTGLIVERRENPSYMLLFTAGIIGFLIACLFGTVYFGLISRFYLGNAIGFWNLVLYCFLVFVPGDVALTFLGAFIAKRLIPLLKRQGFYDKPTYARKLAKKVKRRYKVSAAEAMKLYSQPLAELTAAANEIRIKFCGNGFDICTIINGKCGKCSENCRFCAQSAHYGAEISEHPLLSSEELYAEAAKNAEAGVVRFSIVTSGKKLSDDEIEKACEAIEKIKRERDISVCASFGLLDRVQFEKLKAAGVERIHNNLETSRKNFPNICTTHSFDDKIAAVKAAQAAGLTVCSGGIIGLGETREDRISMASELRELGIKSVPVNVLNPIKGTPLGDAERLSEEEILRTVAVFRFMLPDAAIRLAGGRGLMKDKGKSCFLSGANAAISGDMLTTSGITVATDLEMIAELGYEVGKDGATPQA